jgi:hypothetical protein
MLSTAQVDLLNPFAQISLVNPAFAASTMAFNRVSANVNARGEAMLSAQVNINSIFSAAGVSAWYDQNQHAGAALHFASHSILFDRIYVQTGMQWMEQQGDAHQMRGRFGLLINSSRKITRFMGISGDLYHSGFGERQLTLQAGAPLLAFSRSVTLSAYTVLSRSVHVADYRAQLLVNVLGFAQIGPGWQMNEHQQNRMIIRYTNLWKIPFTLCYAFPLAHASIYTKNVELSYTYRF